MIPHLGGQELDRRIVEVMLMRRKKRNDDPDTVTRLAMITEAMQYKEILKTETLVTFKLQDYNGDKVDWVEAITVDEMSDFKSSSPG